MLLAKRQDGSGQMALVRSVLPLLRGKLSGGRHCREESRDNYRKKAPRGSGGLLLYGAV